MDVAVIQTTSSLQHQQDSLHFALPLLTILALAVLLLKLLCQAKSIAIITNLELYTLDVNTNVHLN